MNESEGIEESDCPHEIFDDKKTANSKTKSPGINEPENPDPISEAKENQAKRVRITRADLEAFGYTDDCPRCIDLQNGHHKTSEHHSEACRIRMVSMSQKCKMGSGVQRTAQGPSRALPPPVDPEPEPAKPKDRRKRQSEPAGMDVDATDADDDWRQS